MSDFWVVVGGVVVLVATYLALLEPWVKRRELAARIDEAKRARATARAVMTASVAQWDQPNRAANVVGKELA